MWECVAVVAGMRQPGAAAWSERKLTAGAHLMKMVTKVQLADCDHLGAERPVVAVGGVDVKSAARPAHRTGEKCGRMLSIPACPPHTAELLLRNVLLCLRCTVMIVVVPAGTRRRQARKARPGGRGPCDGRSAHRAIIAMCDTADSFHVVCP